MRRLPVVYDPVPFPCDECVEPATGANGIRDSDASCETYREGTPGRGSCMGDGHYLCPECREFAWDKNAAPDDYMF